MRTTTDIAAIITIIMLAAMVNRKTVLLEREKRTSRMLYKANQRLFGQIDEKLTES
jgi:nitrate/nitrite-specific signal transduction histidine kinase